MFSVIKKCRYLKHRHGLMIEGAMTHYIKIKQYIALIIITKAKFVPILA